MPSIQYWKCVNETPIEAKRFRDQEERKLRECVASLVDLPAHRIREIVEGELRNNK